MEDHFDRSSKTPLYWYNCSCDLRGSAAALCAASGPEFSAAIARKFNLGGDFHIGIASSGVYEMLWGMSIELLLKAIAVAQRKDVPHHHNLTDIALAVNINLAPAEEALLPILTAAVRWLGRYPLPKTRKEWEEAMEDRRKALWAPAGIADFEIYNGALDWTNINALWEKLSAVYWEHHSSA
jgi:hypothetical protein